MRTGQAVQARKLVAEAVDELYEVYASSTSIMRARYVLSMVRLSWSKDTAGWVAMAAAVAWKEVKGERER